MKKCEFTWNKRDILKIIFTFGTVLYVWNLDWNLSLGTFFFFFDLKGNIPYIKVYMVLLYVNCAMHLKTGKLPLHVHYLSWLSEHCHDAKAYINSYFFYEWNACGLLSSQWTLVTIKKKSSKSIKIWYLISRIKKIAILLVTVS